MPDDVRKRLRGILDRVKPDAIEHLDILDALERHDPEAAQQAVVRHLRNIEADVLRIVSSH